MNKREAMRNMKNKVEIGGNKGKPGEHGKTRENKAKQGEPGETNENKGVMGNMENNDEQGGQGKQCETSGKKKGGNG